MGSVVHLSMHVWKGELIGHLGYLRDEHSVFSSPPSCSNC